MTDSEFMLHVLSDGREHSTLEIIQRSIRERGCGITPHSRASDLRKRGHRIDCDYDGKKNGRPVWIYRLGLLNESDGTNGIPLDSAGSESSLSLSESLSERGGVGAAAMSGSRTSEPERPLSESELVPLFEVPEPQRKPAWS